MQSFKKVIIFLIVILSVVAAFLVAFSFFNKSDGGTPSAGTGTQAVPKEEITDPDAGIFVSKDKGATWRGIAGTKDLSPAMIRFGEETDVLFVGTAAKGLWKSADEGKTFVAVKDDASVLPTEARIDDVAVVSDAVRHAYVAASYASKGHVFELVGSEFRELYFTPTTRVAVTGIALDSQDPEHLFIVVQDGSFLESADGGESWKPIYRFTSAGGPAHVLMHPRKSGIFWVTMGKSGGIFRSVNGGRDWKNLDAGLRKFSGARTVERIYFDDASGTLYLTSKYGLLRSRDDGTTWEAVKLPVPPAALPVVAVAVNPKNSRELYVSASGQLYRSIDGGESWTGKDFGSGRKINAIAINPANPREIFIGFDK